MGRDCRGRLVDLEKIPSQQSGGDSDAITNGNHGDGGRAFNLGGESNRSTDRQRIYRPDFNLDGIWIMNKNFLNIIYLLGGGLLIFYVYKKMTGTSPTIFGQPASVATTGSAQTKPVTAGTPADNTAGIIGAAASGLTGLLKGISGLFSNSNPTTPASYTDSTWSGDAYYSPTINPTYYSPTVGISPAAPVTYTTPASSVMAIDTGSDFNFAG